MSVTLRDSMAIFYLDAAIISACTVSSPVRAAAYRHAVRMVSHAFTETTSFTHKAQAMVHAEIALPEDAPEWAENAFGHAAFADALRLVRADVQAQDLDMSKAAIHRAAMARVSEQLWNAVEHGEIRLNKFPTRARYARSLTVALPRELDQAAQIALMQGYVRASLCDRGLVADWVIHDCQSRSKKGQCPGAKLDTWFDLGAHPGACAFQIADACQGALAAGQPFRSFGIFRITVWRFCSGATGSFRRSSRGYGRGGSGDREWRL